MVPKVFELLKFYCIWDGVISANTVCSEFSVSVLDSSTASHLPQSTSKTTTKKPGLADGWMLDDLRFYVLFNSISVISGRCLDNNETLCAMELRLRMRFHLE